MGGGALWAASTLTVKASPLLRAPPEKVLAYQIAVSIPILAGGAWLAGNASPTCRAVRLGVDGLPDPLGDGHHVLLWFFLIKAYSASKLSRSPS